MSEFDNWKEEQERIHNDYDAENAWNSGQQSQQAKIDLLEKELTETQAFLNKQNRIKQVKIHELQKQVITQGQNFNDQAQKLKDSEYFNQQLGDRIDEALRHVVDHGGYDDLTHVINILKGNKDEN